MTTITLQLTDIGVNKLMDDGKADFAYMAVGTGIQVFNVNLTALVTENVRVAISPSVAGTVLTVSGFLNNTQGNATLTECGLFDAASSGNMLAYGTFATSVVKDSSKGLIIDATVTGQNATA